MDNPEKCRTPSGVRGLKFIKYLTALIKAESHPVRGAWIEILGKFGDRIKGFLSHPVRGAWIEIMRKEYPYYLAYSSHPVRGAWIEIPSMTN